LKKSTLVLGASLNPSRYSYLAVNSLVAKKHPVVAIGLKEGTVAGVSIITEMLHFEDIHTITLYLNAQRQVAYYDYILSLKPKRVIFNPGTENPNLIELLQKNNIEYKQSCTLVLLGANQY
jgi:predicted CoA-binding protein